jgi:hypothetical protein
MDGLCEKHNSFTRDSRTMRKQQGKKNNLVGSCGLRVLQWLLTSSQSQLHSELHSWVITQRIMVISYRRFMTTYQSRPQGSRIRKKAYGPKMEYI